MNRELNVLVVEDDEEVCACYRNYATATDKLTIVACVNDSEKAIELLQEYLPDAIILDLELDKGKGSGIDFLKSMKKLSLPYRPFVVVTTNNSSQMTKEIVRSMGIDFFFSKHQKGYSEKEVLEFLESMKDEIQEMFKKADKNYDITDSVKTREKLIRAMITKELDYIGINPKAVGYKYLTEAIYAVINGEERSLPVVVGEIFKKTSSSVERAMQHAIDRAWKVTDPDDLLKYYTPRVDPRRGAPTTTALVYHYANKISEAVDG
ncbi:MAG: response regulator [Lachnospiraceae bacterium]|nr:response regulator [Lachnospiraceae bacterium]